MTFKPRTTPFNRSKSRCANSAPRNSSGWQSQLNERQSDVERREHETREAEGRLHQESAMRSQNDRRGLDEQREQIQRDAEARLHEELAAYPPGTR